LKFRNVDFCEVRKEKKLENMEKSPQKRDRIQSHHMWLQFQEAET